MPTRVANNPLRVVYNRWERFLNDVSKTVGGDRELTDEASLDAIAWQAVNQQGSMFDLNFPLMYAIRLGHAPMHLEEITRLDR